MCFSAIASFGASAVLTGIGVASLRKAQRSTQIAFAGIPIIFAVQQLMEGFLWLGLCNDTFTSLNTFATYSFLFLAQVLWPAWVPYAFLKLEHREKERRILHFLVYIGFAVAGYLGFCLMSFPVKAFTEGHHIVYQQKYPSSPATVVGILYFIVIVIPAFVSSIKKMWILGVAILLSYCITAFFYKEALVSVWCFFAAILSGAIFITMRRMHKSNYPHAALFKDDGTRAFRLKNLQVSVSNYMKGKAPATNLKQNLT